MIALISVGLNLKTHLSKNSFCLDSQIITAPAYFWPHWSISNHLGFSVRNFYKWWINVDLKLFRVYEGSVNGVSLKLYSSRRFVMAWSWFDVQIRTGCPQKNVESFFDWDKWSGRTIAQSFTFDVQCTHTENCRKSQKEKQFKQTVLTFTGHFMKYVSTSGLNFYDYQSKS